ncbi:MAG TPA: TatD family hydrolase [Bacteroidia bacterium]|nr:TatD family hydrolase [Bacteroidia bacterium]
MILTDTHTHLYLPEFDSDRDALMAEAKTSGIERFFLPNIDSTSFNVMHALEKKYPENCFAMMGLHPCSVKENWKEELELVEKKLSERKYFGVGEIGIDLYWDKTFIKEQEEVFKRQIELANQYKLPVSIHSRDSFEEIYSILLVTKKEQPCGAFHCFTGNADQAKRAIALGFHLGIGGVVTFKNSGLDKTISEIDLKYLVLETDSPYLAAAPHRGKRNIPAYLKLVAEKIAAIKNCSVEEVAAVTTENSKTIFSI